MRRSPPAISLVVCTRNRAMPLRRCLEAISKLEIDRHAWELVLVNNGSSDDTDFVLRQFALEHPFRVVLAHEDRPGQSRARNAGVQAASAPIVAFTDDDCYVAPDYLPRVLETFRTHRIGYLGGRILLHDATDAEETILTAPCWKHFEPHTILTPGDLHGANMACRRSVFDAIGGFDQAFGPGTPFVCDDIDFLCRASLAGYAGAYTPDAVVWHHHGRKPGRDVDLLHRVYARGRGAYYLKGCLSSGREADFRRRWYWHLRTQVANRRFGEIAQELFSAARYLGTVRGARA